jgi:branched-chain amino acid transport system ATP-binding protein
VLISEQNLHFARLVADRALVMEKGIIRFDGMMNELMADTSIRERYLAV